MGIGKPINLAEAARLLSEERLTRAEIAKRLGVCKSRLGVAMRDMPISTGRKGVSGTYRLAKARAANADNFAKRRRDILQLYEQGVPQNEIAKRLDCSRSSVFRAIHPERAKTVPVPAWVPDYLHDTYRFVGREHGEEEAASRVRRLKQEAERACL